MIKFFRKIRQHLLVENKFSKYLLYAIGEIILVVIGILIALQINNANELRKVREQEQNYKQALKTEFQNNDTLLLKVIDRNLSIANACRELLQHTGPGEPKISEQEFSRIFFKITVSEVLYHPANGVLSEILNSGKLDIFQDDELKKLLSSWSGVLEKVRFQETELAKYRMALLDMWTAEGNPRRAVTSAYKDRYEIGTSNFEQGNRHLLQLLKFEANLTAYLYSARSADDWYFSKLKDHIQATLERLDEN